MFCEHEWMNENVRDIEARVDRGARVPDPRGPRAGRLWQACEMRERLAGESWPLWTCSRR